MGLFEEDYPGQWEEERRHREQLKALESQTRAIEEQNRFIQGLIEEERREKFLKELNQKEVLEKEGYTCIKKALSIQPSYLEIIIKEWLDEFIRVMKEKLESKSSDFDIIQKSFDDLSPFLATLLNYLPEPGKTKRRDEINSLKIEIQKKVDEEALERQKEAEEKALRKQHQRNKRILFYLGGLVMIIGVVVLIAGAVLEGAVIGVIGFILAALNDGW